MRLIVLLLLAAANVWTQTDPTTGTLRVTRIYNITTTATACTSSTQANCVDNRSSLRQNNYHSFTATGTGTWSVTMESASSPSGPWTSMGSSATVTNNSLTPIGNAFGYYAFIRFNITGSARVTYSGAKDFYINTSLVGGGEGAGISAINNLTDATQFLLVGSTGTDFTITDASGAHTFNLPSSSASARGLLTSEDWSRFNLKESALTFSLPLSRSTNTISCPTCLVSNTVYSDPAWISTLSKSKVGLSNVTDNAQLKISSNLSDVQSVAASRTNLGLGGAAVLNVGTSAGTVSAGDHLHAGVYQPLDTELSQIAALTSGQCDGKILKYQSTAWTCATESGSGGGVTSVNGANGVVTMANSLTGSTQPTWSGVTLQIPLASAGGALAGLISSVEYTALVAKQDALTFVSPLVKDGSNNVTCPTCLVSTANLANLTNVVTARTNLGLGDSATKSVGTSAGTVAAGDHLHASTYQPLDTELSQIAALNSCTTGQILKRASGAWICDTDATGATGVQTINTSSGTNGAVTLTVTSTTTPADRLAPVWETHSLLLPMAATTGVTAGLISKAQYDVFNAKAAGDHNHNGVYEPTDADLTAIAALSCTSGQILKKAGNPAVWTCGTDVSGGGIQSDAVVSYSATVGSSNPWTILGSTHGILTCDMSIQTYSESGGVRTRLEYDSVTCDTSTKDVTINWTSAQAGRVILLASGGGAAGVTSINSAGGIVTLTVGIGPALAWSGTLLNIPEATGAVTGLLTSADWTTFNNKASASHNHDSAYQAIDTELTQIAGLNSCVDGKILKRSSGAWTCQDDNAIASGVSSVNGASGAVTISYADTGTATGFTGGGTTLYIPPASRSGVAGGLLSNADYATFNGKAAGDHNHTGIYQPLDSDLTKIAGLSCNTGEIAKVGVSGWECAADATGSGAVASVNSATGSVQLAVSPTGAAGTAPTWSGVTLNIPMAATSSVTAGLLSKTQYDIFAAKQDGNAKLTQISGLTCQNGYVIKWATSDNSFHCYEDYGLSRYGAVSNVTIGDLVPGQCSSTRTFTITGAVVGDSVAPGWPSTLPDGVIGVMKVSATDTVSYFVCNITGATVNVPSASYQGRIIYQ